MKVTFFGAGDMFSIGQGHNSVLLEFSSTNLAIDFPETNFRAIRELGKDLTDIQNLFITHLHEDHINGLQLLGHYNRVFSKNKPNLYVHSTLLSQLWQTLQPGFEPSFFGPKTLDDFFNVFPVDDRFTIEGTEFRTVKTNHLPGMISHGLLCTPHFYYSSDCAIDPELLMKLSPNVKLIFHECHLQDAVLKSHTSLEEILGLPKEIRDKIVLMHYEDRYSAAEERKALEQRTGLKVAGPLSVYEV
jgi:ribonuclease BN (tRNA processing enzyme)